jgi:hypothetical protein
VAEAFAETKVSEGLLSFLLLRAGGKEKIRIREVKTIINNSLMGMVVRHM